MKYTITYNDAREICEYHKHFKFSEHQFRIDGYKIATFDYFICDYNDFKEPLPGKPEINAFDMRGVTFVFNENGTLWKRFFMLSKFFNLNQVESTQYNIVKDKKINHISSKQDGSLVAFMILPNGSLFSKTIRGFDNDQAIRSMKLLNSNTEHKLWVKNILEIGFTPLFEYVSYDNRIVLKYSKPELRLIGLRDNNNGDFLPASRIKTKIPESLYFVKEEKDTLDNLIKKSKDEENIEGWVVIFNDLMIKIKTVWYWNLHGIRTENIFREDYVIRNYYEEKLDDIMSQLDPVDDNDAFNFVEKVTDAVTKYSNDINLKVHILYNRWQEEFSGDWIKFAINCHQEAYFGLTKIYKDNNEFNKRKVSLILKRTHRLKKAQQIVEKWS